MEIEYVDGFPQPYPLLDAAPYWQALERKELTYQHCTACEAVVWPAKSHCPDCGAKALEWRQSAGRGRLYSFSTVERGPTPAWQAIAPFTVGFVELDEGYHLFTQIEGAPEDMRIDRPVAVRFVKRGRQVLPVFGFAD
jgi:uncharacterized OB-fold protein